MYAVITLSMLLLAAPSANPYPPLTLPNGWTAQSPSGNPSLLGDWRRTPKADEPYPTRVQYFTSAAPYGAEVARWRGIIACSSGTTGELSKMMNLCGFVIDRDEQCKGRPSHRFVRLANLGPPELVAQTYLYVPWGAGHLEVVYERPSTEFAASGSGEKEDDVLAAMRTWCEAAATSAPL